MSKQVGKLWAHECGSFTNSSGTLREGVTVVPSRVKNGCVQEWSSPCPLLAELVWILSLQIGRLLSRSKVSY